eukprot:TRINITY_DN114192_c0_g1_i1.p1 TRINITY_DN114192_c0_g1~~TRINITY_DN114192_c0_g1_i1.p1  ORF type:complete len:291 (-),score=117.24 TRINITY_DN114192_c0_g1_i1:6-845(-)
MREFQARLEAVERSDFHQRQVNGMLQLLPPPRQWSKGAQREVAYKCWLTHDKIDKVATMQALLQRKVGDDVAVDSSSTSRSPIVDAEVLRYLLEKNEPVMAALLLDELIHVGRDEQTGSLLVTCPMIDEEFVKCLATIGVSSLMRVFRGRLELERRSIRLARHLEDTLYLDVGRIVADYVYGTRGLRSSVFETLIASLSWMPWMREQEGLLILGQLTDGVRRFYAMVRERRALQDAERRRRDQQHGGTPDSTFRLPPRVPRDFAREVNNDDVINDDESE